MGAKQQTNNKKASILPAYLGIAFIWFTTQFGGGFASGAQVYSYFIQYGWIGLLTPVLAQLMQAFIFYFVFVYSYRRKLNTYREFTDSFYGKSKGLMSNVYEVVYNVTICLATAVAFATGGSTLNQLTGIPYILCTVIIGVFIFVTTIFGADIVRKAARTISVLIIVGVVVVFVPNIIAQWGNIMTNLSQTTVAGNTHIGAGLWRCILYGAFQLASVGVYVAHVQSFESEADIKKCVTAGFGINAGIILLATLGLYAVPVANFATAKVPTLTLVQNGVGAGILTPIISILILLGSVSTGVNMIYGIINRVVLALGKNEKEEVKASKERIRTYSVAILYIILTFCIAQFGLIPLVAKGYGYLGYMTLVVIIAPIIVSWLRGGLRKDQ